MVQSRAPASEHSCAAAPCVTPWAQGRPGSWTSLLKLVAAQTVWRPPRSWKPGRSEQQREEAGSSGGGGGGGSADLRLDVPQFSRMRSIQSMTRPTLEYIPGNPGSAQPCPHDTTPTWMSSSGAPPVSSKGPPLSPLQASRAASYAQNMASDIRCPLGSEQSSSVLGTYATSTSSSTVEVFVTVGSETVEPQPSTENTCPASRLSNVAPSSNRTGVAEALEVSRRSR
mmetsp:Transcript_19722/g.54776  ORF Transcript_19722/g.54776 Transcript_19722/m.54776 type:complete len:227 (-) Transcript_19722:570-1250(-)